jgi:hypothetical protein
MYTTNKDDEVHEIQKATKSERSLLQHTQRYIEKEEEHNHLFGVSLGECLRHDGESDEKIFRKIPAR